jgi:hypothetical protein
VSGQGQFCGAEGGVEPRPTKRQRAVIAAACCCCCCRFEAVAYEPWDEVQFEAAEVCLGGQQLQGRPAGGQGGGGRRVCDARVCVELLDECPGTCCCCLCPHLCAWDGKAHVSSGCIPHLALHPCSISVPTLALKTAHSTPHLTLTAHRGAGPPGQW